MVKWFSTIAPRQLNGKRIILIVLRQLNIHMQKKKPNIDSYLTQYRKINSKWVTELNARTKI